MREQNTKAQEKQNYKVIPTTCPPTHTLIKINHPPTYPTPPPPIICNNNTVNKAFLAQMRQSNKCGSVRNDEIINLHLGSGAGP